MKLSKGEKIWLAAVILFYAAYNLPFVPSYGTAKGTMLHAALTLIPLWIVVYVGLFKSFKARRLKNRKERKDD